MSELQPARAEAKGFANIALIKYMGKRDRGENIACNPSLSYTLPHLSTTVDVSAALTGPDRWEFLPHAGSTRLLLSREGEQRFLGHVRKLCGLWGYRHSVLVRSANNFPADAGIASSASSFCAATKALAAFLRRHETTAQLAQLSRTGSGSSCRSFFGPWCAWDGDSIHALDFPVGSLLHMVVIVDGGRKGVSSSDAHLRVTKSPHFCGREDRARVRMSGLLQALESSDWQAAYEICSEEFEDMHELFHTSDPPFRYRTTDSERIIRDCADIWATHRDGPIVTMDAGPNVHLLFRRDQRSLRSTLQERYSRSHPVISSPDAE
jgi:diphosphomevalonate decarboxylase